MILPPDWIENSIETYIYQHTTKSQAIYWVVLATIVLAFILLPFVYVDISIQSNGVIRPAIEKTEIKATISGIVNEVYVYEGQKVKKGDILLRFRASSSHEKITYQDNRLRDYEEHIADLKTLSLGGKPSVFRSPARLQEYQLFVSKNKNYRLPSNKPKENITEKKYYSTSRLSLRKNMRSIFLLIKAKRRNLHL